MESPSFLLLLRISHPELNKALAGKCRDLSSNLQDPRETRFCSESVIPAVIDQHRRWRQGTTHSEACGQANLAYTYSSLIQCRRLSLWLHTLLVMCVPALTHTHKQKTYSFFLFLMKKKILFILHTNPNSPFLPSSHPPPPSTPQRA